MVNQASMIVMTLILSQRITMVTAKRRIYSTYNNLNRGEVQITHLRTVRRIKHYSNTSITIDRLRMKSDATFSFGHSSRIDVIFKVAGHNLY